MYVRLWLIILHFIAETTKTVILEAMIEPALARKVRLVANTKAIKELTATERAAFTYSVQRAGSFDKLSQQHHELLERAYSQLTEYDYRFVLDIDDCD